MLNDINTVLNVLLATQHVLKQGQFYLAKQKYAHQKNNVMSRGSDYMPNIWAAKTPSLTERKKTWLPDFHNEDGSAQKLNTTWPDLAEEPVKFRISNNCLANFGK